MVAQWLEHPTGVTEVVGSIPTWNSELVPSPVAKQPSFFSAFRVSHLTNRNGLVKADHRVDAQPHSLMKTSNKQSIRRDMPHP